MLACVERDTGGMTSENAVRYCDNVFKVHCFGLDLLNEIAEAQVDRCEAVLAKSLGIRPARYKGWQTCAEREVFDAYSMKGTITDEAGCLTAFQDKCGTRIDPDGGAGALSAEQQAFVACCSADGRSDGQCPMIDDGFSRGPCLDRPVCVNRLTNEWLRCRAPAR